MPRATLLILVAMQCYVYIVTNRWKTVLYIGMTRDIESRVFDHKTKATKGFTSKYNVDRLVHLETFARVEDAICREKELKKWRRAWKENLINENNPTWEDLSEGWYDKRDITEAIRMGRRNNSGMDIH
jgi:putative endonuclease